MKNLTLLMASVLLAIAFAGCSGKVQTNPLPNVKNYHFPTNQSSRKEENTALAQYGNLWNEYLEDFFRKKNPNYQKSIWQIGLDRKHYEH